MVLAQLRRAGHEAHETASHATAATSVSGGSVSSRASESRYSFIGLASGCAEGVITDGVMVRQDLIAPRSGSCRFSQ